MTENDPNMTPPPATPPPGAAAPGSSPTAAPVYMGAAPTDDAKTMAMLSHILNWIFLVPLLIYLLKKDSHPFLEDQSKEALNFSLVCLIIHIICSVTAFLCIPALISIALFICQIVFGIIGGLKAKDGVAYRYPLNFRMIK